MELHQFSLDIQCTWSFLCLLSFWLICFLNQVLILGGKCSWGRFYLNFLNCSAFLIEINYSWSRNSVTSRAMHWNTFLSSTKNSWMFLWSHLFSSPLEREYWHFLEWLDDTGTKNMKRINSEQCSRTWEGTAAEVALECPRTTQSTPSQALSGAAAAWEGELVQALPSSAAHPIARTGIRKDVLPAGFLFPSGRQFPIPSTTLCCCWQAGDAPVLLCSQQESQEILTLEFRLSSASGVRGLSLVLVVLCSLVSSEGSWCFGREEPDRCGGLAVIQVQHQLLRGHQGLQVTEEVTMQRLPFSNQSVGEGSSRTKLEKKNRPKRNVSAKQTILVNNKFLRKMSLPEPLFFLILNHYKIKLATFTVLYNGLNWKELYYFL